MAEPVRPDTLYARALAALLDPTCCPACTAPLGSTRCTTCGLDVTGPGASRLWADSQAAAQALRRRSETIAELRAAAPPVAPPVRPVAAVAPPPPTAAQVLAAQVPVPVQAPAPVLPPAPATAAGAPTSSEPAAPPTPPRPVAGPAAPVAPVPRPVPSPARASWRVQTVLQVVGAGLLAAASLTFLVFAWDVMTLPARAAVVGGGTLVVFALASLLRRRGLVHGAEAVGAVAVVLLLLDAWALRATGTLVLGPATTQAGVSLATSAVLLAAWSRASRVRVGALAAAVLVPAAPLAWLPAVDGPAAAAALLTDAGALGLLRAALPVPSRTPERRALQAAAAVLVPAGLALAAATAGVQALGGEAPWAATGVLALVGAVLTAQAVVDLRDRRAVAVPAAGAPTGAGPWAATWSVAAGIAGTASAGSAGAGAALGAGVGTAGALLLGCAVALLAPAAALAFTSRAADRGPLHRHVTAGALAAAGPGAVSGALVLVVAALRRLAQGPAPADATSWVPSAWGLPWSPATGAAVVVVLATLGTAALAARSRSTGRARAGTHVRAVAGVLLLVCLPAVLPLPGGAAPLVVGELGVAGPLLTAARGGRVRAATARAGAVVAAVVAVVGAGTDPLWGAVALTGAALLVVLTRTWVPPRVPDAEHRTGTGSGPADAASTLGAAVLLLAALVRAGDAAGLVAPVTTAGAAALVGAGLAVRAHAARAARTEQVAAVAAAGIVPAVAWAAGTAQLVGSGTAGAGAVTVLVSAAVVLAVALQLLRRGPAWGTTAGPVGAATVAPVAALGVATVHALLDVPPAAGAVVLAAALGAAGVLTAHLTLRRAGAAGRPLAEAAGWSVLAVTAGVAAGVSATTVVVVLVLASVTAGAWALQPDRRAAGWLALALGSSAWWVTLGVQGNQLVEPYVVPPGLVLAAATARAARRGSRAAAGQVVGGLALATVPTAVLVAPLPVGAVLVDRVAVATVVAAVLAAGAHLLARRAPAPLASGLAALAAVLLTLAPLRRALVPAAGGALPPSVPVLADGSPLVEPWALAAAVGLAVCATVLVRLPPPAGARTAAAAPWVVVASAVLPTCLAAAAPTTTALPAAPVPDAVRLGALAVLAAAATLVGAAAGRRTGPRPAPGTVPGSDRRPRLADLGVAVAVLAALATAAAAPGLRDAPAAVLAVLTLGAVTLAVRRGTAPTGWLLVGLLATTATLGVRDTPGRDGLWLAGGALLLVLARTADRTGTTTTPATRATWAGVDGPVVRRTLAVAAATLAVLGPWSQAAARATAPGTPAPLGVEVASLGAAVVAGGAALAWWGSRRAVPWPALAVLAALAALPTLVAAGPGTTGTVRAYAVLAAGSALAHLARERHHVLVAVAVAVAGALVAAGRGGPEPADVPLVLLGVVTTALAVRRWQPDRSSSWTVLGAPLVLLLGAPLLALVAAPASWRVVLVLTLAVGATVGGALARAQAPFLLGAAATLTALAVVLSPVAASALARVDGWVLLAVGGAVVLGLGLTYERRVQQTREAVRLVGAMR
ncbi:SCO7613 C-terminal domain-containing membrane protein [Cellulomonas oligotrophica]|uniref:Uncharacterized protein n=1 Tax=Cellulomonas oligotrophica TaxID=931536 RepID=A0A7Y9FCP0_9CELL|nr:hypothetical protein [Cellulomonas oligotrophica]NYD84893.1 hypothetical protein [Cellulomonas oligotrophica]GIG31962.1 hypothetical protein Col01nite_11210 [Cellulomonas oligotrophica]